MPKPPVAPVIKRVVDPLRDFLQKEAAGGILLAVGALAALVWANSPVGESYEDFWSTYVTLPLGFVDITEDLQHWVNDALMVIFFFVVGLEIKRELVTGELREPRAAALPVIAAFGGVVLPALIFVAFTAGTDAVNGWGIPMATDIAFAVGVLALLGSRVPAGAKLFLLTIAIVDDIIAITVIAIFYTDDLSLAWLGAAALGFAAVVVLRLVGVSSYVPYLIVGACIWLATLESGVHATIAGVLLGLLTPARPVKGKPVLHTLEHKLHPVSAFVVIPLFALANAGVSFGGGVLADAATSRVTWGIALGLLVGKTLGITAAALLAKQFRVGVLPMGVGTRQVWAVAAVAGIGFTVSLFISELAYDIPELTEVAKIGIFAGSLASGLLGTALMLTGPKRADVRPEAGATRAA